MEQAASHAAAAARPWERPGTQKFLLAAGGNPTHTGFLCLAWAVDLIHAEPALRTQLYKGAFSIIGEQLGLSKGAVELAIRREINWLWKHSRPLFDELFGCEIDRKPPAGMVICAMEIYLAGK